MRSLLTALGVIIGVGAVIAMVEIGQGSKTAIQASIASMGANTLLVQSGAASSSGVNFGAGTVMSLTPQDADETAAQCPAVADVAPIVRSRVQLVYSNRNWSPTFIYGTTPSFLVVRDWEDLEEGEMFSDRDVAKASQVCVIGETIKRELFQGEPPIGKELRMHNVSFRIIGVLSRKGANGFGMDQDDVVLAPWTTIKYRVSGTTLTNNNQSSAAAANSSDQVNTLDNLYPGAPNLYPTVSTTELADHPQPVRFTNVDQIMVKAMSSDEVPDAINEITELMRDRHHIRDGREDDFNIRDMTEVTKTLASTSQLMSALLLVVALISLVVGGVGIMNIMLVSVTERTREIGLRMAVGASGPAILRQFLMEAVRLTFFAPPVSPDPSVLFNLGD
jgi:ABC-type antimicrobial peptide transport system permease subunit